MAHAEFIIPWKVVPKARPRFNRDTGRAYTAKPYREWLDMTADYVALNHHGAPYEGPLLIRGAFTDHDIEVAIMDKLDHSELLARLSQ